MVHEIQPLRENLRQILGNNNIVFSLTSVIEFFNEQE